MRTRVYGYLVCALVLGAVAYPFSWPMDRDGFPLSNYPMFSRPLAEARFSMQYAVGIELDGTRHQLAPELVGSSEVLQAASMLANVVHRGPRATRDMCRTIAERVIRDGSLERVTEVRIVTGTHDAVAYLTGANRVGQERVHGICPARSPGPPSSDKPEAPPSPRHDR